MHILLALDSDGVPITRVHTRLRLPVPVSPLGTFYTTWKLAYQMHLDARPVKYWNMTNAHVDVYTLGSLRLSSQQHDAPLLLSGGGRHAASSGGKAEGEEEAGRAGSEESRRAQGCAAAARCSSFFRCNSFLVVDQVRMAKEAVAGASQVHFCARGYRLVPAYLRPRPATPPAHTHTSLCESRRGRNKRIGSE